ncbi:MAG: peptide/nickel transport system permease protein [Nocardioidaceae bacterium]|nr:peptide/nickel transport system permease protein [Nocardioidaceae bacterium]
MSVDSRPTVASSPSRLDPLRRFARAYFSMPTGIAGLAILVAFGGLALCAPLFIHPSDLSVIDATGPLLSPPSSHYPLGTDQPGRSVLLLVIWGARPSLTIGLIATALTMVLGSAIGLLAGHYEGFFGRGLMHVTDWFIALPSLPLAIALAAVLGQGARSITIAIAVTSWPGTARLVRAQTFAVEARPFIERAKALGASDVQIMLRHVLPNVAPLILVSSTLTVAGAILSETTLTFLGLGNPVDISWGAMLNQAFGQGAVTSGAWWYLLPPGVAILIVVLGFTMVGRAVEHVLNPRMGTRS